MIPSINLNKASLNVGNYSGEPSDTSTGGTEYKHYHQTRISIQFVQFHRVVLVHRSLHRGVPYHVQPPSAAE